ncbi:MAG: polysaccharide deacetylase family protein [bacterium]|nr:polysaccharide deacetylase family protein [bacterium]
MDLVTLGDNGVNSSNRSSQFLTYHKVDTRWEIGITNVFPKQFLRQMSLLNNLQFSVDTISNTLQNTESKYKLALSFDDGYQSIFQNAFPILNKFGFRATVFLIASYIGKWNSWEAQLGWRKFFHLNKEQIQILIQCGWEIGSHSEHHYSFESLTDHQVQNELISSKHKLEEMFNVKIDGFAFPFGRYQTKHILMAIQSGYRIVCVNSLRENLPNELKPFVLVRRPIYLWDTLRTFRKKCVQENLGRVLKFQINIANKLAYGTIFVQKFRK